MNIHEGESVVNSVICFGYAFRNFLYRNYSVGIYAAGFLKSCMKISCGDPDLDGWIHMSERWRIDVETTKEMLRLVREKPRKVYELAKTLGLNYGTTQYYIQKLARDKLIKIAEIAGVVVVYTEGQDPTDVITVRDI